VFEQIRQGEESGTLSAEEKKRVEEQAAEKGLQALFKVTISPDYIFSFSIQMTTSVVKKK